MSTLLLFATSGCLTGLLVIVTVAEFDVTVPSLTLKMKLSVPLKSGSGV